MPRASTLHPKGFPIHGEAQHLRRGLERPIRGLSLLLPDYAIAGGDILPSCLTISVAGPSTTPPWFVNDLQVEDDATPLDLPGFDPAVEDPDGLGERGDMRAGGKPTRVSKWGCHGVRAWYRAPGHTVATTNVFLQLVGGCQGAKFWRGCHR